MHDIADPRRYPEPAAASSDAADVHRLAHDALSAPTGALAHAADAALAARIDAALAAPDAGGARLAAWLDEAPSLALRRHVWRAIVRRAAPPGGDGAGAQLFAMPLVIVAGVAAGATVRLDGALPDVAALAGTLAEHGALRGNRNFALSASLVAGEALDVARQPALLAARDAAFARGEPLPLPPAPLALPVGESVHLRFVVGSAIVGRQGDVTADAGTGRWGRAFTQALARQLATPGATLLALPRPVASPLAAVAQGRAAQRDVSAQLFASNALRELRMRFGEPAAVISAHHADDAGPGGELRLSLSSPWSPRDAYGFRCPILPHESVTDVATMLRDLLRDARVADVRVLPGVHADRDPVTGGPLMFKPATLPSAAH